MESDSRNLCGITVSRAIDEGRLKEIEENGFEMAENDLMVIDGIEKLGKVPILDLSRNRIINITNISFLTNLFELYLSENNISDISPLASLTKLVILDISCNRISSIASFSPLSALCNLQDLKAHGNPVCSDVARYPAEVFHIQTNLKRIDDHSRLEDSYIYDNTLPLRDKQDYEQRIYTLSTQLSSIQKVFEAQEDGLARNGLLAAQHVATVNSSGGMFVTSSNAGNGADLLEGELIEQFPYYRVLQSTRKQLVQSLTARVFTEKQLQDNIREMKDERRRWRQKNDESERKRIIAEGLHHTVSMDCERLKNEVKRLSELLQQKEHTHNATRSQANTLKDQLLQLSCYVDAMIRQDSQQGLQDAVVAKHMLDRLAVFEKRLTEAAEHIRFVTADLQDQKIRMHNERAALEIEKRMHQLDVSNHKHKQAIAKSTKRVSISNSSNSDTPDEVHHIVSSSSRHNHKDSDICDDNQQSEDTSDVTPHLKFLSDIDIDVESEGFLTNQFHELDPTGIEYVNLQDFLQRIFLHYEMTSELSTTKEVHAYLLERLYDTDLIQLLQEGRFFQPLGVELFQILGANQFIRMLISMLSADPECREFTQATIGDLVLHLYPDLNSNSRTYHNQIRYIEQRVLSRQGISVSTVNAHKMLADPTRSVLSREDREGLRRAGVLGDMYSGAVPLAIPTSYMLSDPVYNREAAAIAVTSGDAVRQQKRGDNKTLSAVSNTRPKTIIPPPSITQLQADNDRLLNERKYLLKKVQETSRSLENRAERIKSYFEKELTQSGVKIDRLQRENGDLKQTLNTAQERIERNEKEYRSQREILETTVQTLRDKVAEQKNTLETRTSDQMRENQEQLAQALKEKDEAEDNYKKLFRENKSDVARLRKIEKEKMDLERQKREQHLKVEELRRRVETVTQEKIQQAVEMEERLQCEETKWEKERIELLEKVKWSQEELNLLQQQQEQIQNQIEAEKTHSAAVTESAPIPSAPPLPPPQYPPSGAVSVHGQQYEPQQQQLLQQQYRQYQQQLPPQYAHQAGLQSPHQQQFQSTPMPPKESLDELRNTVVNVRQEVYGSEETKSMDPQSRLNLLGQRLNMLTAKKLVNSGV